MKFRSFVIMGEGFMFTNCTGLDKSSPYPYDKTYLDIYRANTMTPIKHLPYSENFVDFVLFIAQKTIPDEYTDRLDIRRLYTIYNDLIVAHDTVCNYCNKHICEYREDKTRIELEISDLYVTIKENYNICINNLRNK